MATKKRKDEEDEVCTEEMCAYCFASLINHFDHSKKIFPPTFQDGKFPLFVTWQKKSKKSNQLSLRGCIGTFGEKKLYSGLKEYALTSALNDSRFKPMEESEIPFLECGVSLLYDFEKVKDVWDWEIGVHGIIIDFSANNRKYNATYLPEVMPEQNWNQEETFVSLIQKAGFRGEITRKFVESMALTRYKSSKNKLSYEDYKQKYQN